MKILILGASGQLGQCIKRVAKERMINDISFPDEQTANILDPESLSALFLSEKPNFVINCAAYTAVDKAEDEIEVARAVNATGAENIAICCAKHDATMIHISTDFVFAGNVPKMLEEGDSAAPIGAYGLTKLEGEDLVQAALIKHIIIRTSWLYSEFANNFVKTMLRLSKDRNELGIIVDQVGTPTYAVDLAKAILDIIEAEKKVYGIFHYSNEGAISWYDFAKEIFETAAIEMKLNALTTDQYPTKAKRPPFSVMNKAKIKQTFGVSVPYWKDSLKACINQISIA